MSNLLWSIDRSAGLVSWALLTASTVLGLLLSSRTMGRRVRGAWLQDLHRGLAGLAIVFLSVHVAAAVADSHLQFGVAEVLVPFASEWRPGAVTWGVVAIYLLVAVQLTSMLRTRLPHGLWRRVHVLSFPLFVAATLHGVTAGSDLRSAASLLVVSAATAAVIGLTALRIATLAERTPRPARATANRASAGGRGPELPPRTLGAPPTVRS